MLEKIVKEIKETSNKIGNGICDLTILFIAFKLLGVINWSWWWVLSPLWLPICLILVIIVICSICYICIRW